MKNKNDNKELIVLQSSHVTQHTKGGVKTEWKVEANITNALLGILPKHLSEQEVFSILDFARGYELSALNIGINFQKGKQNEVLKQKLDMLSKVNLELVEENEKLANALDSVYK